MRIVNIIFERCFNKTCAHNSSSSCHRVFFVKKSLIKESQLRMLLVLFDSFSLLLPLDAVQSKLIHLHCRKKTIGRFDYDLA